MAIERSGNCYRVVQSNIFCVIVRGQYTVQRADIPNVEVTVSGNPDNWSVLEQEDALVVTPTGVVNQVHGANHGQVVRTHDIKGGVNFNDLSSVEVQVPVVVVHLPRSANIDVLPL